MNRVFPAAPILLLLASTALFAQSTSTQNPDDVPQQHPPGTNNPDISKQRRPAPAAPKTEDANQNSADVPQQHPGTNNPDVAKQRQPQDSTATDTAKSTSQHTRGKKKKTNSTTATQ